jgi:hypothetical protein
MALDTQEMEEGEGVNEIENDRRLGIPPLVLFHFELQRKIFPWSY